MEGSRQEVERLEAAQNMAQEEVVTLQGQVCVGWGVLGGGGRCVSGRGYWEREVGVCRVGGIGREGAGVCRVGGIERGRQVCVG